MLTQHPQAGDGIIDAVGRRWIVDGQITRSGTNIVIGVTANRGGEREEFYNGDCRRETFTEYLTRPTGFGRTSWHMFTMIQAACAALLIAGIPTWNDGGWVAVAMVGAIETVLAWQSHRNYTGKTR
jgi:hypothetical protein